MGNSLSSISPCPGFVAPLERTLQRRRKMLAQHGKGQLPVISSSDWRRKRAPGVTSVGGRGHRASLDSYRPPQAGQSPANKVLSRHGLPAPLGAWGLENLLEKLAKKLRTRQKKENTKEVSSTSHSKLERQDHVSRSHSRPSADQRCTEDCRHRQRTIPAEC